MNAILSRVISFVCIVWVRCVDGVLIVGNVG